MGTGQEPPEILPQERLSDDFFTDGFETEGGGRANPQAAEQFFHEQIGDAPESSGGGGGSGKGDADDAVDAIDAEPFDIGIDVETTPGEGPGVWEGEGFPSGEEPPPGDGPPPEQPAPGDAGGPVEPLHDDDPPVVLSE